MPPAARRRGRGQRRNRRIGEPQVVRQHRGRSTTSCCAAGTRSRARKGAREAHVDDVQKFFQPKTGTLWQYFAESLAPTSTPGRYDGLPRTRRGQREVQAEPVVFLKRAAGDRQTCSIPRSPARSTSPRCAHPPVGALHQDRRSRAAARRSPTSTPRSAGTTSPGRAAARCFTSTSSSGEGDLGYADGEWALFHLLEDGKLDAAAGGRGVPGGDLDPARSERG